MMYYKVFFVCSLLAAFAVQEMQATELKPHNPSGRALSDIIEKVKQLISALESLVNGTISNAIKQILSLIDTINDIKDKFLNEGLSAIKDIINGAFEFIANKTHEAADLGLDFGKCIVGTHEELEDLASSLITEITECVMAPVDAAMEMIGNSLKILNEIVQEITGLPLELAKCLLTLRPISCLNNLIADLTEMLTVLPKQIAQILAEVYLLVDKLPDQVGDCVSGIIGTVTIKVAAIVKEVGKCFDDLVSGATSTTTPTIPTTVTTTITESTVDEVTTSITESTTETADVTTVTGDF